MYTLQAGMNLRDIDNMTHIEGIVTVARITAMVIR